MRIYSYLILLFLSFLTGCLGKSARQKEHIGDVIQNDTAYVIEPFLKEDVTYIDKTLIIRDYNYFPPQEYELSQMAIKIQCETAMVTTDVRVAHTILAKEYWKIEDMNDPYSPSAKLAILKTDKGEIRIAEVKPIVGNKYCVFIVKYDKHIVISESLDTYLYCRLPSENILDIINE